MDTQYRSPRKDSRYEEEAAISLPLLDDVNELIEKEKILLEFKVLEQQKEASEWKAKYDSLLGKVAENANISEINENFRILEEVADSALETTEGPDVSNLIDYIHKVGDHYILDMSGKSASFVVSQITQGSSILKHYSNVLNAVSFRGCGLKDDSALLLCSKFRRKKSPEILLLHGNVPLASSTSFGNILSLLTFHSYALGVTLKDFRPLIFGQNDGNVVKSVVKKDKEGMRVKKMIDDYTNGAQHPMNCLAFMKALNAHLRPEEKNKTIADNENKNKMTPKKTPPVPGPVPGVRGTRTEGLQSLTSLSLTHAHMSRNTVLMLENVLEASCRSLTELDLSYSYSSRAGAEVLRNILGRNECRLTRLNMTGNALMDSGLQILCTGIEKSRSLTYLDIRSNGISATGLSGIIETLLTRCALSVLDISNNNDVIESDILRGAKKLRENGVKCELRRGSSSTSSASSSSSSSSSSFSTSFSTVMRSINQEKDEDEETRIVKVDEDQTSRALSGLSGNKILYSKPNKMTITFKDGEAMLYSIDVKNILQQQPVGEKERNENLIISWCFKIIRTPVTHMKSVSTVHDDRVGSTNNSTYENKTSDYSTESTRNRVKNNTENTENTISWEIRTVCPKGRKTIISNGTVSGVYVGSQLQSNDMMTCQGHVPRGSAPLKGRIEVSAVSDGIIEKIEISNLEISALSSTSIFTSSPPCQYYPIAATATVDSKRSIKSENYGGTNEMKNKLNDSIYHVGGDNKNLSHSVNKICSVRCYDTPSAKSVPRLPLGFFLARRLVVMNNEKTENPYIFIRFLAKLHKLRSRANVRNDLNNNGKLENYSRTDKNEVNENKLLGWGYEWRILILRSIGSSVVSGDKKTGTESHVETLSQGICEQTISSKTHTKSSTNISSKNNNRENVDYDVIEKEKEHAKKKDDISHLVPWTWSGITAELGHLNSGDEILVVTRSVPPHDSRNEISLSGVCGVDVKDCEVLYCHPPVRAMQKVGNKDKETDMERERVKYRMEDREDERDERKRDDDRGDRDGSGPFHGTLKTGHFVIMNDPSLQLPCC